MGEIWQVDLARILAAKVLGRNPELKLTVIDFATQQAIEGPYRQIDAREPDRVILYGEWTLGKSLEQILEEILEGVQQPRGRRR